MRADFFLFAARGAAVQEASVRTPIFKPPCKSIDASEADVCPEANAFKSAGLSASIASRFDSFLGGGGVMEMRSASALRLIVMHAACMF